MPIEVVDSLDDQRIQRYRNLRYINPTRYAPYFIAESRLLVDRLIDSDYEVDSILAIKEEAERLASIQAAGNLDPTIEILSMNRSLLNQLLGFKFHRGSLACGLRKAKNSISGFTKGRQFPNEWTGVGIIGIQDPENVGGIIRSAIALGVCDIFIGPGNCDPFARRVLRVSMGVVLKANFYWFSEIENDFATLHSAGIQTVASSLQPPSIPLNEYRRNGPQLLLFGNEGNGLPSEIQGMCDHRVSIPMQNSVDSLNVNVAAGIMMHSMTLSRQY